MEYYIEQGLYGPAIYHEKRYAKGELDPLKGIEISLVRYVKPLLKQNEHLIHKLYKNNLIDKFISNGVCLRKLANDEIYYRYHDQDSVRGTLVMWLTDIKYENSVSEILVRAGSWVIEGLTKQHEHLFGGHYQAFIDIKNSQWEILQTYKSFKNDKIMKYPTERSIKHHQYRFFLLVSNNQTIYEAELYMITFGLEKDKSNALLAYAYFRAKQYTKSKFYADLCKDLIDQYAIEDLFLARNMIKKFY